MNADDRPSPSIPLSLHPSIPSRALDHWTTGPLTTLLRLLVRLYQCTLGTVLPNSCRYQPTCSHYALDALSEHGAIRGTWLAVKRILRCHPFARGGYDPVPVKDRSPKLEDRSPDLTAERRTITG